MQIPSPPRLGGGAGRGHVTRACVCWDDWTEQVEANEALEGRTAELEAQITVQLQFEYGLKEFLSHHKHEP